MYAVNIKFTNKIWSVLQKRNDDRTVLPLKLPLMIPFNPFGTGNQKGSSGALLLYDLVPGVYVVYYYVDHFCNQVDI